MTQPFSGPAPGWEAQAIAEYADRLGLVWKLRPGTVDATTDDPTGTAVTLDGDTEALNAYSIIGLLRAGQRVMCAIVPPSGLYVVGLQGGSPAPVTIAGALAETAGTLYTISTGTETNIAELRLENVSVDTDHMYAFQGSVYMPNGGAFGDSWLWRWRESTALTGTVVAEFFHLSVGPGFTDMVDFDASMRPAFPVVASYHLSVQRIAGAGTLTILGSGRSHSRLTRLGTFSGPSPEFISR